jgi:hypothetical protein
LVDRRISCCQLNLPSTAATPPAAYAPALGRRLGFLRMQNNVWCTYHWNQNFAYKSMKIIGQFTYWTHPTVAKFTNVSRSSCWNWKSGLFGSCVINGSSPTLNKNASSSLCPVPSEKTYLLLI